MHIHTQTHTLTDTHTCTYTRRHTHGHVHSHTHTHSHSHTRHARTHTHTHDTLAHARVHTRHARTRAHTRTRMRARTPGHAAALWEPCLGLASLFGSGPLSHAHDPFLINRIFKMNETFLLLDLGLHILRYLFLRLSRPATRRAGGFRALSSHRREQLSEGVCGGGCWPSASASAGRASFLPVYSLPVGRRPTLFLFGEWGAGYDF